MEPALEQSPAHVPWAYGDCGIVLHSLLTVDITEEVNNTPEAVTNLQTSIIHMYPAY